jgi:antitoxin component YwqK of YwqJK toxin-antitoxin module
MKMKRVFFIIWIGLVIFSCNRSAKKNASIDCELLQYDNLYNHFYLQKRSKGYTGTCESFYPNGTIKEKRNIKEGKNNGPYVRYFASGKLLEEGNFEDNLQNGIRKVYDENGKLISKEEYNYGQLKIKR